MLKTRFKNKVQFGTVARIFLHFDIRWISQNYENSESLIVASDSEELQYPVVSYLIAAGHTSTYVHVSNLIACNSDDTQKKKRRRRRGKKERKKQGEEDEEIAAIHYQKLLDHSYYVYVHTSTCL